MALADDLLIGIISLIEILQQGLTYLQTNLTGFVGETYFQLMALTVGMTIFAIFIWHFYKSLSKRDLIKLDLEKYRFATSGSTNLRKIWDVVLYILKYGLVFPVFISIWFLVLSLFLILLTGEMALSHILMTSIVIVSASRIVSYYKEDLAVDLAKLMPFALLAILISNPNFFAVETTVSRLTELTTMGSQIIEFLIFSIVLEWSLRSLYLLKIGIGLLKERL